MSYGRGAILGGSTAGLAMGQEQMMKMQRTPPPAVDVREVDAESNVLTSAMEDLARHVDELDTRLTPVLRQIPIGVGSEAGSKDDSCTSPLGQYLAAKTAMARHLTWRVQGILERLAV